MKDETLLVIISMCLIAGLEALALLSGVNGTLLSGCVGVIAGLAGYYQGKKQK